MPVTTLVLTRYTLILTMTHAYSEFDPEYKLVASSYQSTEDPTRVFFGHLDFKDGQAIYQKVGLYLWNDIQAHASN